MQYYVERAESGFVGNCLLWWKKGHHGYTCNVSNAHLFDEDAPRFIDLMKSNKYRAWPRDYILKISELHVNCEICDFDQAITK